MLSKNIKIDLHIHSKASEYKEPKYENGLSMVFFFVARETLTTNFSQD